MVAINNFQYIPIKSKPISMQGNILSAYNNSTPLAAASVKDAKNFASQGDEWLQSNKFNEAINCYKKSIAIRPDFKDTYFDLGKAYKGKEDYKNAINSFSVYAEEYPQDTETKILLGECYTQTGHYSEAKAQYDEAVKLEPDNDLAKRNAKEAENLVLSCYDYQTAQRQRRDQAYNNLNQALGMARDYLPAGYFKDMGDITVTFDKTAKLGGTSNIAQYEHSKRKITVTDSYVYAAPQLVCAYLVHEFVHAKDKDSYTSIREEQDAYGKEAEFWLKHSNGVKDPEMDYAADLYKESPQKLSNRVAEIYKLRDPDIAETSPNHPPSSQIAANSLKSTTSGQPLRNYDIIS